MIRLNKNGVRALVAFLSGHDDFFWLMPWRPTRGLPTFSSIIHFKLNTTKKANLRSIFIKLFIKIDQLCPDPVFIELGNQLFGGFHSLFIKRLIVNEPVG